MEFTANPDTERLRNLALEHSRSALEVPGLICAWISGSLIEGLGNDSSDVDVFVLCSDRESLCATRHDVDHSTYAFVSNGQRFDVEYWTPSIVHELAAKLGRVKLDDPQVNSNHALSYWESEFIHRALVGEPLLRETAFFELRSLFDAALFAQYLFENCVRRFDDAFDDAVGMLMSGQTFCAALRSREVVGLAIDALLYATGVTNDKMKFRSLKLRRLSSRYPEYRACEERYRLFEASLPAAEQSQRVYTEEALAFSGDLMATSQDIVYHLKWEHLRDSTQPAQRRFADAFSPSILCTPQTHS